ncbi:interferon gamma receptor 2 isoform X1 [Bos indicus x Bos taurus]|uniref:Interferon gamma receptor 2 n=1 Tax=Bos indicus x Bos taurus TaxID=30522 RepID=A0A4W2INU9_BOBOX|nr:interferon gamma receptor 2 isoform X1 [Bos indicus x Bos taurus]
MRPPPPTLLPPLLLMLSGFGAAAPPADSLAQLPAPGNLKVHLYNAQQALSWEPVSLDSDPRPVVYQVQYKYSTSSNWYDVNKEDSKVDCTNLTGTECDFTANSLSEGFPRRFNISLRVRAKLGGLVSAWATAPWFEHYRNATIGPPENIRVTPEEGSLIIRLSAPFDVPATEAYFVYCVYYWEKAGAKQVTRPFRSNFITLNDLKPLRVYCFQVKAELFLTKENISRPGHLSNISCCETAADASVKLQQDFLAAGTTFLVLSVVVGSCLFLVLRYRGLVKHWFHSPPRIPSQIEEYLKDPAQPILDALDKDSSPKDDTWDSVSVVTFPENEQEGSPQSTLNQSAGPSHQPTEGVLCAKEAATCLSGLDGAT